MKACIEQTGSREKAPGKIGEKNTAI